MTTCTFVCSPPIIDQYFYARLQNAVFNLVCEHDAIDFLLRSDVGGCYLLCLRTIMEAKQSYPQKHITLSLLGTSLRGNGMVGINFPDCVIDRLILSPAAEDSHRFAVDRQRIDRWMMRQADYIIQYHYTDLKYCAPLYRAAMRSKARVIDLTRAETVKFIKSCIPLLPPELQAIKTQWDKGATQAALCKQFRIRPQAMATRFARIARELRYHATKHYREQTDPFPESTLCSILLEFLPQEQIAGFRQTIQFLIHRLKRPFFLLPRNTAAEVTETLESILSLNWGLQPPCRFEDKFWADIIAVSDCVICTAPQLDKLQALLQKSAPLEDENIFPKTKVFDICRLPKTMLLTFDPKTKHPTLSDYDDYKERSVKL